MEMQQKLKVATLSFIFGCSFFECTIVPPSNSDKVENSWEINHMYRSFKIEFSLPLHT